MRCLKCGTDIPNGQVFCDDCQADAKAYPVKPGTPISLNFREDAPLHSTNVSSRRLLTPSEQVLKFQRTIRKMRWLILLLTILLMAAAGMLLKLLILG